MSNDGLTPEQRAALGLGPPPRPKSAEEVRRAAGMSREEWMVWSEATSADQAGEMMAALAEIKDERTRAELRERLEQLEDAEA